MIQVSHLEKSFEGFRALKGVDMHVEKGAIYGLVGPNGAGKSTLIRHITGVYKPDAGEVLIAGEPVYENKKVKAALNHGFTTLLCIGETAEEKDFGISAEVLRTQLKIGFHDVPVSQVPNIWVAYEPVWSIGVNGTPASADYAEKMHKVIKACLREIFGDVADEIPVLYGGSVNPGNANELIVQPSIDGLFTGRAAWQADNFDKLIRDAKATYEAK